MIKPSAEEMIANLHNDCGATEAECKCLLEAKHNGPHACDCGGRWISEPEFDIVSWPIHSGLFSRNTLRKAFGS